MKNEMIEPRPEKSSLSERFMKLSHKVADYLGHAESDDTMVKTITFRQLTNIDATLTVDVRLETRIMFSE